MLSLIQFSFILLFTTLIFVRPAEWIPPLQPLRLMSIAMFGALGSYLLRTILNKKLIFVTSPVNLFLLCFWFSIGMSDLSNGFLGMAISGLNFFFINIMLYMFIILSIDNHKKLDIYLFLLIILTLILSISGIVQYYTGVGLGGTTAVTSDGATRVTGVGIFNDPNDLAMVLASSIPLSLYFIKQKYNFLIKIVLIAIVGAALYAIVLTNSRGGILSIAGALGYLIFRISKHKVIASGIGLFVVLLFLVVGPSRMSKMDGEDESAEGRLDAWYEGIMMLKSRPIFGVGYDRFTEFNYLTAHNSYVLAFAETGFVGFFFWLGIIFFSIKNLLKIDVGKSRFSERALFLEATMLSLLISIFFLSRTYTIVLYVYFAIIVALFRLYLEEENVIKKTEFERRNYIAINDILLIVALEFSMIVGIFLMLKVML